MKSFSLLCLSVFFLFNACKTPDEKELYFLDLKGFPAPLSACYLAHLRSHPATKSSPGNRSEKKGPVFVFKPSGEGPGQVKEGSKKILIELEDWPFEEKRIFSIQLLEYRSKSWVAAGTKEKFGVRKIHPENQSPYGLDDDEICEQMAANTVGYLTR